MKILFTLASVSIVIISEVYHQKYNAVPSREIKHKIKVSATNVPILKIIQEVIQETTAFDADIYISSAFCPSANYFRSYSYLIDFSEKRWPHFINNLVEVVRFASDKMCGKGNISDCLIAEIKSFYNPTHEDVIFIVTVRERGSETDKVACIQMIEPYTMIWITRSMDANDRPEITVITAHIPLHRVPFQYHNFPNDLFSNIQLYNMDVSENEEKKEEKEKKKEEEDETPAELVKPEDVPKFRWKVDEYGYEFNHDVLE